jgi:nitrogen fixation NifU-like protein
MDDLAELYQQVILDHNRRPRNFGKLDVETGHADGYNPTCGDRVTVHVRLDRDVISAVTFEGSGCAISKASASLMTAAVSGKAVAEAEGIFQLFQSVVTADPTRQIDPAEARRLGPLAALAGVRAFPSRVKCATLAWHALRAAVTTSDRPNPAE